MSWGRVQRDHQLGLEAQSDLVLVVVGEGWEPGEVTLVGGCARGGCDGERAQQETETTGPRRRSIAGDEEVDRTETLDG